MDGTTLLMLLVGLLLGAIVGGLWARGRSASLLARATAVAKAAQVRPEGVQSP